MAGEKLGNTTFETYILSRSEVSGALASTIDKVEDIVAEAVSTAWKAGGSKPASAFASNTLLVEANEGKVYNLEDQLTITDQIKQFFTENATGTYPAGTNIAVIESTPAVYAAATGTAVSGTTYYEKYGNNYVVVPVTPGSSVAGLYVRTSDPSYLFDVLAGSDASSVKKIKVGATAYSGAAVTICGAANNKDGYMSSGSFHKLSGIEAGANKGIVQIQTDDNGAVVGTIVEISGGTGIITHSGGSTAGNNNKIIVSGKVATSSAPGIVQLASSIGTGVTGVTTGALVSQYVSDYVNVYSTINVKRYLNGSLVSGSITPSGTGTTLVLSFGPDIYADIEENASNSDDVLLVNAVVPIKSITLAGESSSLTPVDGNVTITSATSSSKGIMKLYGTVTGTNNDGAVTQSGVKAAIDGLRNYSQITTKYQTWRSGDPPGTEWHSGSITPGTNSAAVTVRGDGSVQVSAVDNTIRISVEKPDSEHGWPGVVTLDDTVGSSSGANKGVAASPLMVRDSMVTRVKKSITLSGLRQVSNDTQTPIPLTINSTDMPNTLYGLIKALKFAANHAS